MAEFEILEDKYVVNFVEDRFNVSVKEIVTLATPVGSGDMVSSTYDPNSVSGDVFNMDNMINGSTNLLITQEILDTKRDLTNYKFGDVANNTEFESDGTLTMSGTATVWEDIQGSLIGRRLFSNVGRVDYSYDENSILFSDNGDINDNNDCITWNYQYPHSAKLDGKLMMHMHYEQSGVVEYEFTLRYRIQDAGQPKEDIWTDVAIVASNNNVFPYSFGVLNQICTLADVDMSGHGLSAQVQFRLTRTDSNGGTVSVTFVDGHYERDTLGSDEQFVK